MGAAAAGAGAGAGASDVPAPVAASHLPAATVEAAAAAEPPRPPKAAEPIRVEPYELPAAELQQVATAAGLEWVGSDAAKVAAVQAAMAAEPAPVHVPREPKPRVVIDEGPLVLVETRKDLSQIRLPFEQQQG